MNIHITDKVLVGQLINATLSETVVGSHLHKTNNENSDVDILCIYATSENELYSPFKSFHQYQYIDEYGNDYIFTSLHSFIENILNGDSQINFEVLQSYSLINSNIHILHKYNDSFITYNTIKMYLGICMRDVRHFYKETIDYNKKKRLGHIIRGYLYAKNMINHTFDIFECDDIFKQINIDISNNDILKKYTKLILDLRNELNEKFENKTLNLPQNINVKDSIELNNELLKFCKSDKFKEKQAYLKNFNMDLFINSIENWVSY